MMGLSTDPEARQSDSQPWSSRTSHGRVDGIEARLIVERPGYERVATTLEIIRMLPSPSRQIPALGSADGYDDLAGVVILQSYRSRRARATRGQPGPAIDRRHIGEHLHDRNQRQHDWVR